MINGQPFCFATYWKQFGKDKLVYSLLVIPGRMAVCLEVIGGIVTLRLLELDVYFIGNLHTR